ncbi:MAG: DUF547 domain-containing protein [Salinisphaera sp.]|nr:DUF547 domain-containing protein [Salinisphaera sp.]
MVLRKSLPLCGVLLLASAAAMAASQDSPWQRWTEHNPKSEATIDHSAWTAFLQKYLVVDPELDLNRVRYAEVTQADRKALDAYIHRLEAVDIGAYNRDVQRAYWINLYNAATLRLILQHYPLDSIRDIGGGFFGLSPDAWEREVVTVGGVALTLDDIENHILRQIWDDGLNHYGLNCASVGCPNLRMQAYTGTTVYQQLRDNAKAYVNSPRGLRFSGDRLELSSIYDWYQEDFGGSETTVISYLRRFAAPALSARLDAAKGIAGYYYNWSLNEAK